MKRMCSGVAAAASSISASKRGEHQRKHQSSAAAMASPAIGVRGGSVRKPSAKHRSEMAAYLMAPS